MSQRTIQFAVGEYYHIYNRGTDKRTIFLDDTDYKRFTELLYLSNTTIPFNVRDIYSNFSSVFAFDTSPPVVGVGVYCLMPNHFHLLVTPLVESGVSEFMRKLGTSYSMYFNKKYDRTGALFEGKFKAQHASTDEYLKYLYSYIHLNPVKLMQPDWKEKGIKNPEAAFDFVKKYDHSSLGCYVSDSVTQNQILDTEHFPAYFLPEESLESELMDWLTFIPPEEGPRGIPRSFLGDPSV